MADEKTNSFTHDDYEIVNREILYQGVFRLARYRLRFRLFKGGMSRVIKRELLERKPAASILPYDPQLDQVVLIEQFRVGAMANPPSPWLTEIVAGVIDEDHHNPIDVAIREAHEEAGCEILDLYPICEYFVSPGGTNEYLWVYCGRILINNLSGLCGLEEEDEDIRVLVLPLDEALTLLQEGKIKTAPAIISLQWLQLNREWLKQLWQIK
jgi:ADP-ribose pyrophosphatase